MAFQDQNTPLYNLSGALIFCAYVFSALLLTCNITLGLVRRYLRLNKDKASTESVRIGKTRLNRNLLIFSALAVLSFSTLSYNMLNYLIFSYQDWAYSHRLEVPQRLLGKDSILGPDRISLAIWQWLTTSTLFQDFAQTICGNSARFWWTQQALFATMAWSLFMSFEGRRRGMSNMWTYAFISQILPVSFAEHLFFIDMLLTLVPSPEQGVWTPSQTLPLGPLVAYFGFISLAPYAAGTGSFIPVISMIRILLFCPLFLRMIVPSHLGGRHLKMKDGHAAYMGSLKFIGICSAVLYIFQTAVAFSDHGYRDIIGAINDDPAVSALGYDYLLSLVGAFIWVNLVGSNLN